MKSKGFNKVNLLILIPLLFWGLIIAYPFYNAILTSMVSQKQYVNHPFMFWPRDIDWSAYKFIFESGRILTGYRNTILITIVGVTFNMLITTGMAYGLSRKNLPFGKFLNFIAVFTMFFSGGLIPFYLLIKKLGLNDSLLSIILSYGINTFYLILMKNYFLSIPDSLEESAKIDGANDITILVRIMLPLAKPILATLILFYTVDRWNEWYHSMLFLRSGDKWTLQLVLRNIINSTQMTTSGNLYSASEKPIFSDGIKMAAIVVTMLPIMIFYPFVQKYFMKGIMVGSVKS